MVGIYGLGGIAEPANTKAVQGSAKGTDLKAADAPAKDGLNLSPEAEQASDVAKFVAEAVNDSEIRAEKIRQAQENIEQGTYRIQEVVLQVASRIANLVG